ncbi:hypothetical protein QWY84_06210 [Aquisalimonas lutea]|uniref:FkbM family methyltransferase n=1 Tax=Aquisalimonas lutea TaxID=1327750 RepID=UPI0025B598B7|nr:FkbM family methyltransferase [Aquisalimonas lutea]MDN3517193.1 hypothetical protein [Aquisalimonas lutea]
MIKRKILNAIEKITGVKIYRIPKNRGCYQPSSKNKWPPSLESAFLGILTQKGMLKIIQLGANEGKVNDPLYSFVTRHSEKTSILLVEPQEGVAKALQENYKAHPCYQISVSAVGNGNDVTFYSVKPEYWEKLNVPYARDWPPGRAATGVCSSHKQHVIEWLKKYLDTDKYSPEDAINAYTYKTVTFSELLARYPTFCDPDVLQIDIEGADDVAVLSALDDDLRPAVINFESKHLPEDKLAVCLWALEVRGYSCFLGDQDTLCLKINT